MDDNFWNEERVNEFAGYWNDNRCGEKISLHDIQTWRDATIENQRIEASAEAHSKFLEGAYTSKHDKELYKRGFIDGFKYSKKYHTY